MPTPDPNLLLKVLHEGAGFARRIGLEKEASEFEQFHVRFRTEKPTLKALRHDLEPSRNTFSIKVREILFDDFRKPRPGKEIFAEEYCRIVKAFGDLIYPLPPQPAKLDISRFEGGDRVTEKSAPYFGDVSQVRRIVEETIDLVQRYSRLIGEGNFDAAYLLTATGLQAWMSKKRFATEHEKAARQYHGPALDYLIDMFQFIYADDAARKKSKADEGRPKKTPKEERRSCVTGFWIRDRSARTGCSGGFLISEERCEYRIACFTFYTQ